MKLIADVTEKRKVKVSGSPLATTTIRNTLVQKGTSSLATNTTEMLENCPRTISMEVSKEGNCSSPATVSLSKKRIKGGSPATVSMEVSEKRNASSCSPATVSMAVPEKGKARINGSYPATRPPATVSVEVSEKGKARINGSYPATRVKGSPLVIASPLATTSVATGSSNRVAVGKIENGISCLEESKGHPGNTGRGQHSSHGAVAGCEDFVLAVESPEKRNDEYREDEANITIPERQVVYQYNRTSHS